MHPRTSGQCRFLHAMLRVGDLRRSIDFYTGVLGMQLLRTVERAEQGYTLAFVGYGGNPDQAELELTYNHGVDRYEAARPTATLPSACRMYRPPAPPSAPAAVPSCASRDRSRAARRSSRSWPIPTATGSS